MVKVKTQAPIGAIASIALYLLSVHFDVWSKISGTTRILLAIGFLLLFFADYTTYFRFKVGEKDED